MVLFCLMKRGVAPFVMREGYLCPAAREEPGTTLKQAKIRYLGVSYLQEELGGANTKNENVTPWGQFTRNGQKTKGEGNAEIRMGSGLLFCTNITFTKKGEKIDVPFLRTL